MKPQPKRTTTQQGLGKVTGEPRRNSERTRVDEMLEESARISRPITAPQIDAPPPNGSLPGDGPAPRHTRAIESGLTPARRQTLDLDGAPATARSSSFEPAPPASERGREAGPVLAPLPAAAASAPALADSKPPKSQPIDRVERADRGERVEREERSTSSRAPIDVTHVDTDRLQKPGSGTSVKPASARPVAGRFDADEKATGTRRTAAADARTGSRTVDGRPVGNSSNSSPPRSASTRPTRSSVRPPSGRPARTSTRPPAPRETPPVARSRRPSIREDDVGAALKRGPSAAPSAGQVVPRLLLSKAEIAAAPIDHRAGFLLAHIDGVTSVQGLVDIAGMAENEVQEILDRLRRLGIVAIR